MLQKRADMEYSCQEMKKEVNKGKPKAIVFKMGGFWAKHENGFMTPDWKLLIALTI